ncbi:hypothetical protein [Streptomyces sp. NPDC006195]|uniref:hypothetical protein n=1 Tax=unclassified Streptomyces TaxID=2593676 RepID=UPI0033BBADF0
MGGAALYTGPVPGIQERQTSTTLCEKNAESARTTIIPVVPIARTGPVRGILELHLFAGQCRQAAPLGQTHRRGQAAEGQKVGVIERRERRCGSLGRFH